MNLLDQPLVFMRSNKAGLPSDPPAEALSSIPSSGQLWLRTAPGLAEVERVCRRVCAELRRASRMH